MADRASGWPVVINSFEYNDPAEFERADDLLFGGLSPKPLIDDGLPERNARVELEGRRCVGAGSR